MEEYPKIMKERITTGHVGWSPDYKSRPDPEVLKGSSFEPSSDEWLGSCDKCRTPYRTHPPKDISKPLELRCGRMECTGTAIMSPLDGFPEKSDDEKWRDHFVLPIAAEMKRRGIGEMRIKLTEKGTAVFELLPENPHADAREP